MKIGSLENKAAVSPAITERKTNSTSGAPSPEPSAKVELSAGALLGAGGGESVFDAEKVRRIAEAIRDGKFEVNAEAIADKLIANAHELLSPRSGG
ncbi:flagellar biosynthesis anti-sigma factor FlgM [Aquincola sp. S2]|uniref:Negative regulator of flagellin synthesis n=1 Tax=Pseudaquabacterium terrae TaxID=2732868 RepID=A0ABX2ENU7_9BURK|nr:flagellar biosynthesis anti-sigma factor FlgM [Aquabacterium terrae]NRF70325.1 flagellar biosynthesis anti-sigma factor FlgM [Aquabacterium terrae]